MLKNTSTLRPMCLKNECNIFLSTRLSKLNVMRVKLAELVLFVGNLVCLTLLLMILFVLVIRYNQNDGFFKTTKKIRRQAVQGCKSISFHKVHKHKDVYFRFSAPHK